MKAAALPSVQVDAEVLDEVESVLTEGESVEGFIEAAVRAGVDRRRRVRAEFVARALRSRDEAHRTGEYVDADVVIEGLQRRLEVARARIAGSSK